MDKLLITLEDFQQQVIISENLKDKEINPLIRQSQERYVKSVLCPDLYVELIEAVDNCDLTAEQEALMSYVKPFLIMKAYIRYLMQNGIKGTNQGLVNITGDNAELVTDKKISELISQATSDSEYYESKLTGYLEHNKTLYTSYNCKECSSKKGGFRITKIGESKEENLLFL